MERWNHHVSVRQDFLGWIDMIVLDGEPGPLGVQVTSGSNVAARIEKARSEPRLRAWLESGARLEVWGYRKLAIILKSGKKGKAKRWQLRRVPVSLTDLAPV